MAEGADQFNQILSSLLSSDNNVRAQAEEVYNKEPLTKKVFSLLNVVQTMGMAEEERTMAAVLLRRLFTAEFSDFYSSLTPEAQQQLKERLLLAVQSEQLDSIRRKICDVVAEVARNLLDDDGNNLWPEFLQFLFQCANGQLPQLKEAALRMFTYYITWTVSTRGVKIPTMEYSLVAGYLVSPNRSVPGVFGNHQAVYLNLIKQMLQQSLLDTSSYHVRFQAVRAVAAFVLLHEKEVDIQNQFVDLLPLIIQVIAESVQQQDDDALLKSLIDMCESTPKFLRPQVVQILDMCLKVFSNEEILDSWRHLSLEVIVTLTETAPAMMRREAPKYLAILVPLILRMMTDLEDDDDWSVMDEISDEDNDSNNVVAESALDRLACSLGGKTVFPHIASNIPEMMKHPDWKYRHAALMAISAVGEGCQKYMADHLPTIVDAVLHFISDPHPRVRYAACNAIGQMSTDFAPNFQKKFHARVVPGLLNFLEDNENPRVQAHAGAALVNFSEECPKTILTQYLNAIMAKLNDILGNKFIELVQKGTKLVLEQVVTTIASVADSCEEQFVAYYDTLVPRLKYIIKESNQPELKLLRGKTIECISLIGLAVGSEKFMADAVEVMDLLLKTHTDLSDDDPQTSYLISAWARICKVMGKQFEQYLPLVIGPVMRAASMKPEIALLDNDDMEEISQDVEWQFISLGEQQNFGIKTADEYYQDMNQKYVYCLEDKASACEMLVCYARELKEGFAEYAEEVVRLMVPLLKFYFHDGVRTAAAQSLPCLLECAQIKGPEYLLQMWNYICPELLKAINTEPESDVLSELMYSMAKCIETLGSGCLSEAHMAELLKILDKQLKEHFEREVERLEKRKDEDYDEVVEEQLEDDINDDIYMLSKIADIVHALFLAYKTDFFPFLDQIVGHFVKLLEPDRPWSDHQWGLCIFDDVIEMGGPACAKYQNFFLAPMLQHVTNKSPEVRQAAVYGCGMLGMHGGEGFAASCAEVLPRLVEIITAPDSREPENISATENAISAVTKILQHNNKNLNVDEILPHWLSWLPVSEDKEEAPHVYGYLCHLIENNHPAILGPSNANLPKLIAIIAEAFSREAITPDHFVGQRMLNIVRQIQGNSEMFQFCATQLTPEQQLTLNAALSGPN